MATRASEMANCLRCGIRRTINVGASRKARSTGLCRDCYLLAMASGDLLTPCPVCDRLVAPGGWLQHRRSHDPDRSWICPLCARVLLARGTHMTTHHKTDPSSTNVEYTHP